MFIGSFKYSIDAKNRISIPAKLRKFVDPKANDSFVMTRGTGKCIDVYPMNLWEDLVQEKLNSLNNFEPKEAMFLRMFMQQAAEDKLDTQARLSIPKTLIEYAEIDKEVLILGAIKRIEIWNPNVYEEYIKTSDLTFEEIAKQVMGT
ncbi:MAG: division/cell wall cluster transcriptional repressor MraZ [Ignavibacteriae bacterium]|nr:division/cell wall cluster transcriptional repressor MraZ [Ignavibacteriota bacterium]MCB0747826.1 division/cell wall cluster transcriptional repressor MraZ [Ignavibacteriota bacterium]MCB0752009.1 division/cell wall cluster transcriptional repressor MraZ [Ignavibacteriota bacterium]MCB9247158.1 division/cell wall cluster transcriptional repressor MraZ [Ignavibacteriales bacterium]